MSGRFTSMRISRSVGVRGQRRPSLGKSREGVALIIVLAFVVLLTGLIVAFFSRSLLDRQISNSSVDRSKVSAFADGATDAIIGDLKQEIVLSSSATTITSGTVTSTVYTPLTPVSMLPQLSGTSGITSLPPNILKISGAGQLFYSGTDSAKAIATIPASGVSNVLAVSSTIPSLNGRFLTPAYWNEHYLLPITSATDATPAVGTFTPPSWILVARDGSNPTPAALASSMTATGTNPIVGRYAFAIYHEGGLIDVNAAGYPFASQNSLTAYKEGEAYADLSQLPGFPSKRTANDQIDKLVAWRNYASIPVPGSTFLTPGFTAASGSSYNSAITSNTTGYLSVSGSALNNNQSDHMFTSRQELIKFVQNGLGVSGTALNVLNYLTTFSRDLNQPSYTPNPNRPLATGTASGGNPDAGGDNYINPPFLTAAVTGTFTRNDGSIALVGEPLVKKRFALSRLAWVTCNGPIASDNGGLNPSGDTTISQIITILENQYGYSPSFLAQGGPTNIYKYFGLIWTKDNRSGNGDGQYKWAYDHASVAYPGSFSVAGVVGTPIRTPASVAYSNPSYPVGSREPDFFEILKAAMPVGSLGKASQNGAGNSTPLGYQASLDNSVDAQVIQIGANIINQAAVDSYTRRILYSDGSYFQGAWHEFHGVVDLPYLYRLREGKIMTQAPSPAQSALPSTSGSLSVAGLGVVLQEPEIWNPHAFVSATTSNPRPTVFQLIAVSTDPNSAASAAKPIQAVANWRFQALVGASGGATVVDTSPIPPDGAPVNTGTAPITFTIPKTRLDLFREPTLLIKPGIPTGSQLAGPSFTSVFQAAQYIDNGVKDNNSYTGILLGTVHMAFKTSIPQGGIDGVNPQAATSGVVPAGYVSYPTFSVPGLTYRLQYQDSSGNWETYDEKYAMIANAGSYDSPAVKGGTTPRDYNKTFSPNVYAGATTSEHIIGSELSVLAFDPRTGRFGMMFAGCNGRGGEIFAMPLGTSFGEYSSPGTAGPQFDQGWAAPAGSAKGSAAMQAAAEQNAVETARPDEYRGFTYSTYDNEDFPYGIDQAPSSGQPSTTLGGWYPVNFINVTQTGYGTPAEVLPGLFSQNNPATGNSTSGTRFDVDNVTPSLPITGSYNGGQFDYSKQYFADPDGVVRRAIGAYVPMDTTSASRPALPPALNQPSGLPMKVAMSYLTATTGTATPITSGSNAYELYSRPIILNRPFRTVAELGYVFSDTPWRNLDMNTPESAAAPLLDAFCINDSDDSSGLVAGKVNLNTRQAPVLQAILAGVYKDEFNPAASTLAPPMLSTTAARISAAVLARTNPPGGITKGLGPLENVSELVGKWYAKTLVTSGTSIDGSQSYVGFTSDPVDDVGGNGSNVDLTYTLGTNSTEVRIPRFREAAIRALSAAGQTRVWNLLIDVVAQTGRYPSYTGSSLANFLVEGQQHYWVHVAIDRFTGQVLDKQIEIVKQ
jgi:hypothetical protein